MNEGIKVAHVQQERPAIRSSFLSQQGISRTTADRLSAAHEKSLRGENGTSGSIPELTDEEIAELAKATWKKMEKKLGTKHAAYTFLGRLAAESGVANFKFTRGAQRGLALIDPDVDSTPQTTPATAETSAAARTSVA